VIEEIGRIVGYDRISGELPPVFEHTVSSELYRNESRLAHAMLAAGYREVVTLRACVGPTARTLRRRRRPAPGALVEISNPLRRPALHVRFSSCRRCWARPRDTKRAAAAALRIGHASTNTGVAHESSRMRRPFETGMVAWVLAKPKVDEPIGATAAFSISKSNSLAILRALSGRAAQTVTGAAVELHPGKSAALLVDGTRAATIAPSILACSRHMKFAVTSTQGSRRVHDLPGASRPSLRRAVSYPAIERDLALVVAAGRFRRWTSNMQSAKVPTASSPMSTSSMKYRGPQVEAGKKSIAVRIVLQRNDTTLTDAEADRHIEAILRSLDERCGARMRG